MYETLKEKQTNPVTCADSMRFSTISNDWQEVFMKNYRYVYRSIQTGAFFSVVLGLMLPNIASAKDSPSTSSYRLEVSLSSQHVLVYQGDRLLADMLASTGSPHEKTPLGHFHIQAERGVWFYSPLYNEGAKYWISFKNHGEFLFHSIPMDIHQHILKSEAQKLGQPASHGCVRLSLKDAQWLYTHIPNGTDVYIHP